MHGLVALHIFVDQWLFELVFCCEQVGCSSTAACDSNDAIPVVCSSMKSSQPAHTKAPAHYAVDKHSKMCEYD